MAAPKWIGMLPVPRQVSQPSLLQNWIWLLWPLWPWQPRSRPQNKYRIHSNSSALVVSKTWSWCMMMSSISDLKLHAFFMQQSSISPIFVCQELDADGGLVSTREWASIWMNTICFLRGLWGSYNTMFQSDSCRTFWVITRKCVSSDRQANSALTHYVHLIMGV